MSLLLLERADRGDPLCRISPAGGIANIPTRPPGPGEQYRFHFDMSKCIGCRCCEVACAEQNGNPFEINWRKVGEIEGGSYPHTQRLYLSMGVQSLPGTGLPAGLPGGRLHQEHADRTGAALCRCLHRMRVLHLELPLRRAAIQRGTRRGRQVRSLRQPPGRRARPGLRECLPGTGDPGGAGEHRRVARRSFRRQCARHAFRRAHHLHHAHHPARKSYARVRTRGPPSRAARGSALAAGGHAGAHAAFRRRFPLSAR